jgi:hypothetical protein
MGHPINLFIAFFAVAIYLLVLVGNNAHGADAAETVNVFVITGISYFDPAIQADPGDAELFETVTLADVQSPKDGGRGNYTLHWKLSHGTFENWNDTIPENTDVIVLYGDYSTDARADSKKKTQNLCMVHSLSRRLSSHSSFHYSSQLHSIWQGSGRVGMVRHCMAGDVV